MKYFRKTIQVVICMMIASLLYIDASARQSPPDEGEDPQNVPIDGGISLLIAAGVAYGAKKAHDSRKKNC